MLRYQDITLRKPEANEAAALYDLMTTDEKWTKYNGPYFGYTRPTFEEFLSGTFASLQKGDGTLAIEFQGHLIGTVNYYWEDQHTRWLEAGIVIFDSTLWNAGLGKQALFPWITHIFETEEIERVGMTTWSGNPRMIASAKRLGFQVEGVLRKVRYYEGVYYDSVKLGVTRDEWRELTGWI